MKKTPLILFALSLLFSQGAMANEDSSAITELQKNIDIVWIITAGALVFFMQAGFALVESGMSRAKNSINVIMKNYMDVCIGSVIYLLVGFGLMFGSNPSGLLGTDHFFPHGLSSEDYALIFFQTMFAATAATIASGAMAERTHYRAYLYGTLFITGLIYPVFGSWAWGSAYSGQGWLAEIGFIDFAGSTVVHSIGGWIALAGIIVLGPRLGRFGPHGDSRNIPGHNLTLVALGGFILWLGWFGFNAGSTLSGTTDIGLIALNTHIAAVAGAIGTLFILTLLGKPLAVGVIVNGSLGGLVSITAGAASMEPTFAIISGFIGGMLVVWVMQLFEILKLDDVVGAVAVHGFCGAWGTLAVGLFQTGALFDTQQIFIQLFGIVTAFLWSFPTALIMYYLIEKSIGLRVEGMGEQRGLDYSEHEEIGYPEFQNEILHAGNQR